MKYTNSFCSMSQLFLLLSLLAFSELSLSQPAGLYRVKEGDQVFKDQMEVTVQPSSISLNLSLSTFGTTENNARMNHQRRIEQLSADISAKSAHLNPIDADFEMVKPSGILKIRSSERTAISGLSIDLYSDQQIADVIDLLFSTDGIEIQNYQVTYAVSDNDLTTELANRIIAAIGAKSKETGEQLIPQGLSQMDVDNEDFGLDYMDLLISGLVLEGWKQSDDGITLIQRSKKISVAVVAR